MPGWPAGGTLASIAREGVLWKTGLLSLPPMVGKFIQLLQAVLDRMAALELMLLQKPIVSGRYSGAAFGALQIAYYMVSRFLRDFLVMCLCP